MSPLQPALIFVAQTLKRVAYKLHAEGQDALLWTLFCGGLWGLVCALPAMAISEKKGLNTKAFFWINVTAGTAAGAVLGSGFYFAVPVGIVLLVVACSQANKTGRGAHSNQPDNGGGWIRIVCPVLTLVLCLVVLPQRCTESHTVARPDNRSVWDKLKGVPAPTEMKETTSWGIVIIVTGILTLIAGAAGITLADETNRQNNSRKS